MKMNRDYHVPTRLDIRKYSPSNGCTLHHVTLMPGEYVTEKDIENLKCVLFLAGEAQVTTDNKVCIMYSDDKLTFEWTDQQVHPTFRIKNNTEKYVLVLLCEIIDC